MSKKLGFRFFRKYIYTVRNLISIVLVSVFLIQASAKFIIYINFKINQDYIAKNLCVKKEIANNDCEGGCCLKESLEKEEKSENPLPNFPKEKSETFFIPVQLKQTLQKGQVISNIHFIYMDKPTQDYPLSIFHPPQTS